MKEIPLNFNNVPNSDRVLVLGGGPSTYSNRGYICEYYERFSPIVITPHYEHYIPSDFVVYASGMKFKSEIRGINCRNIIVSPYHVPPKMRIQYDGRDYYIRSWYVFKYSSQSRNAYDVKDISIKKSGTIEHGVGNSGMASLLASVFFNPTEILLAGFDGPHEDLKSISKFDGTVSSYPNADFDARRKKMRYFSNILIPHLLNRGITIKVFKDDNLWGSGKERLELL